MSKSAVFSPLYILKKIYQNNAPYVVCLIGDAIVTVLKTRLLSKPFPDLPLQLSSQVIK